MKHILGVEGSLAFNLESGKEEYIIKTLVSQDVIDWLENHDIEITAKGERIFIMNKVRYIYLGIQISLMDEMYKYQKMYDIMYLKLEQLLQQEMHKQHEK